MSYLNDVVFQFAHVFVQIARSCFRTVMNQCKLEQRGQDEDEADGQETIESGDVGDFGQIFLGFDDDEDQRQDRRHAEIDAIVGRLTV